ncbi:SAM-dependent methyltransferase [Actinocorallia sp. B10E7]|uniref:SAM-dependent methyltransferase n=1 Tax=Actinocorallia sp. B10E7 TaxID=3153558 RepID=UPI00325F6886
MAEKALEDVDPTVPSMARIYDYGLGGTDNHPVDREISDRVGTVMPESRKVAVLNRALLRRAVRYLAGEAGIRQFLDLGSGLPTRDNTHQVAGREAPDVRVVYVDDDPTVRGHAAALLSGDGRTAVVTADLRDTEAVLAHPDVVRLLDFDEPLGVLMSGILHHFPASDDPAGIAAAYLAPAASGSHLLISHFHRGVPEAAELERKFVASLGSGWFRTTEEITAYFGDLRLLAPGVVPASLWRPDPAYDLALFPGIATRSGHETEVGPIESLIVGGVARKE